ncbi:MAG: hypothetical protein ACLTBD_06715 [Clostridia bacterium]
MISMYVVVAFPKDGKCELSIRKHAYAKVEYQCGPESATTGAQALHYADACR